VAVILLQTVLELSWWDDFFALVVRDFSRPVVDLVTGRAPLRTQPFLLILTCRTFHCQHLASVWRDVMRCGSKASKNSAVVLVAAHFIIVR